MKISSWLITGIAFVITACGTKDAERASDARDRTTKPTASAKAASNVSMTAEQVAEEARGRVKCPAKIKSPARAKDAPVDDVVGVRPGMTYDEAANTVMCTNELLVVSPTRRHFSIQTYGQTVRQGFEARFAEPKVQKTSKEIMAEWQNSSIARASNRAVRDVKPGQAKWYVATMGIPGEERVISAAREEWFEEGAYPTVDSVQQALIAKYGTPTNADSGPQFRELRWAYDPRGRLITETSPLFHRCRGMANPDGATNFSPDCGVIVAAYIGAARTNPDLAEFIRVGALDGANGYEAITSTEQRLHAMEMQRRAEETKAASKNAAAPTL